MTGIRGTLLAVAAFVLASMPTPSQAYSDVPTMEYPLARIGDTVDVEVMLEAPAKSWQIRRSAKFYDEQVDGLTIHTRGTCRERPLAVCVRVFIREYTREEMLAISPTTPPIWHGVNVIPIDPDTTKPHTTAPREIHLNASSGQSWKVAAHELGHAIGLGHHSGTTGIMIGPEVSVEGAVWVPLRKPSTTEIDVLRAHYGTAPISRVAAR